MENINNSVNTVGIKDETLDNLNASANQLNLSGGDESQNQKPVDAESSIQQLG